MTVKDNGKGLQPGDRMKANSFGLLGIKERIHSLGGELIIANNPGKGTALSISVVV
jgi:signal transduction histidine kinase